MYSAAPYGAKELEILHAQFPEVWNNLGSGILEPHEILRMRLKQNA